MVRPSDRAVPEAPARPLTGFPRPACPSRPPKEQQGRDSYLQAVLAVGGEAGGVNPAEGREGLSRRAPQAVSGRRGCCSRPSWAWIWPSRARVYLVSGIAHTNVSQCIGEKYQCCKEVCHLVASVGAEESRCFVKPSPGYSMEMKHRSLQGKVQEMGGWLQLGCF